MPRSHRLQPCRPRLLRFPRLPCSPGLLGLSLLLLLALGTAGAAEAAVVPELDAAVRVVRTTDGIPHVYASRDTDAIAALGYLHARDRLFQMDSLRRIFSGTYAELVGSAALGSDIQLRTLGLRRAAERTYAALSASDLAWIEAYAHGVNAYLQQAPLPPEYGALELSKASVPPWTVVDSLVIAKGLAFGLSFDLSDIDNTVSFMTFSLTGAAAGFDGAALFFEDVFRVDPLAAVASVPAAPGQAPLVQPTSLDAGSPAAARSAAQAAAQNLQSYLRPATLDLARSYLQEARENTVLRAAVEAREADRGSNWWMFSGEHTTTGTSMMANDPHLALDSPATFYEAHLLVFDPQRFRVLNASGISFPGVPALAQGCNMDICWGSTTNPMDVTDVYQEILVLDPTTGLPVATLFDGQPEPLVLIPQVYRANTPGNGVGDDVAPVPVGPAEGGITFVVPRRNNGPIVNFDFTDPANAVALSVQYTGWGATFEVEAFRRWLRAKNVDDFVDALQSFDVGSQNWSVIDRSGTIAYFTSAEMPLREDLQELNAPDGGIPPFLIRDGSHQFNHEWLRAGDSDPRRALPYQILPFDEMPQSVNPAIGFLISGNNDPVGTTFDNNPLNQLRPGGGLYYLNAGYASLRAGRIQQMVDEALATGPVSLEDLQRMQADNQLLDAQLLTPFILDAFDNASAAGAPAALAALAADAEVAEAVSRLEAWDFTTPTGITEGYDPGDDATALTAPGADEVAHSVAATLYSTWRGQAVRRVVDDTLAAVGLDSVGPGSRQALMVLGHLLLEFDDNQGVGASGIPFFPPTAAAPTPENARDLAILESLRSALDLLASDDFAPAFGGSTDQDDYRWGYLHRIVFDNDLGSPFSMPSGGGLQDLAPGLPGVARAGGFQTVDASAHSARADGVNEFMFGSGPARRFVGTFTGGGLDAWETIPGGASALPGSPFQSNLLMLWLTNSYRPLVLRPQAVQQDRLDQMVLRPAP
ncbi:MAG: penicillin acylase family protein [Acidobacteriota bacterium]|nr:penicillin acylase family protein [Acidobacteriota bacterium]